MTIDSFVRPNIDPEVRIFVDRMSQAWASHPPFESLPAPDARRIAEEVRAPWREGGPAMANTTDFTVQTSRGPMRARLYDPGISAPRPTLIYLHGGGFVLFSINTHDRLMREYAAQGGFAVLGVDYPLSPEARYPAALEAITDLIEQLTGSLGADLGIDPNRLLIGGDSAGGNLAMAAAMKLRDEGFRDRLKGLLLNYGAFRLTCSDEAEARFGGPSAVLSQAEMGYYLDAYLGPEGVSDSAPYAEPINVRLNELPPVFLAIPECDILAEQSLEIADRLASVGVAVTANVYRGATHSFLEAMSVSRVAAQAISDGAAWAKTIIAAGSA